MKRKARANHNQSVLLNATYYGVVSFATVIGLLSYSSGATLEGTLARVAVTLMACTLLGYVINVVIWFSQREAGPVMGSSGRSPGTPGTRSKLDLVAGDDFESELAHAAEQAAR